MFACQFSARNQAVFSRFPLYSPNLFGNLWKSMHMLKVTFYWNKCFRLLIYRIIHNNCLNHTSVYVNKYVYLYAFLSLFLCLPSFFHFISFSVFSINLPLSFFLSSWTEKPYKHRVEPAFNCSSTYIFSIQLKYMYRENYRANGIECVGK